MALSYNGTNIPSSGNVIFNGTYCSTVTHNNTLNGNYYLMLETDAGATSGGLHTIIQMTGCYLI